LVTKRTPARPAISSKVIGATATAPVASATTETSHSGLGNFT
jgi:hypothetical protein